MSKIPNYPFNVSFLKKKNKNIIRGRRLDILLKAGATQTAPQSNTQHLLCAGQSWSRVQPLADGSPLGSALGH